MSENEISRSRLSGVASGALIALATTACNPEAVPTGPHELTLGAPRVVVSEGSSLLARPAGVEVDAMGLVYVLDRQDRRVIVVTGDGELVRTIGREGEGPGEFSRPQFFGITGDEIRVLDSRRVTVQVFGLDGTYSDGYLTDVASTLVIAASFGADGTLVYSGLDVPRKGGLVAIIDPAGGEPTLFGNLIAEDTWGADFITEIHERRIPEFMRNNPLPMLDPGGDVWLFLETEGTLRRYSPDGALLHSVDFDLPEMEAIRAEYFDWYVRYDAGVLRFFSYVVDGFADTDRVWLLWSTPAGSRGLITVHDDTGTILWRLVFTLPPVAAGPASSTTPYVARRYFAVDPARHTIYLADTDTSSLVAFEIPAEVFR